MESECCRLSCQTLLPNKLFLSDFIRSMWLSSRNTKGFAPKARRAGWVLKKQTPNFLPILHFWIFLCHGYTTGDWQICLNCKFCMASWITLNEFKWKDVKFVQLLQWFLSTPYMQSYASSIKRNFKAQDCSYASWRNKECFLLLFVHSHKTTFSLGKALNPAVACSRPCVDIFFWQIQDELKKQCEKKYFFQAVVPSFIWESENLRKQKTILLQLQLCGKSQKPQIIKWKTGEIPAERHVLKRRCQEQSSKMWKVFMGWHGSLNCKTWWIFFQ